MNKDFLNLVLGAFEAVNEQERRYEEAFAKGGGVLAYSVAVDLAADRLRRALAMTTKGVSRSDLVAGLLVAEKYKGGEICWDEQCIVRMIDDAKTSYWTHLALKALAAIFPDTPQLPSLKRWRTDYLLGLSVPPIKPRGKSPYEFANRNTLVLSEVKRLKQFGFNPTRAKASSDATSACDVIVDALGTLGHRIGYSAVENIWTKRSEQTYLTLVAAALSSIPNK